LCATGWRVSFKRVERIWRREGLKVPAKQPKRGRLWLTGATLKRTPQLNVRLTRNYPLDAFLCSTVSYFSS
jgi:hypothetical protein